MNARPVLVSLVVLSVSLGCGGRSLAGPEAPAAPATSGSEASAGVSADLPGLWVEFWAVSGSADTQRYAFFEDGRFGWTAAANASAPVAQRWGRWEVAGSELVLSVEGHDERFGCEARTACRVRHAPPVVERLALGRCPENDEARALDETYRCLSFDGQAFWRVDSVAPDPTEFLQN